MAKDPAFLFYPGDYLRDTQCLSEKAQVAYDRIMCEHMRNICKDVNKIGVTKDKLNFFIKRLSDDEKNDLMHVLVKIQDIFQIEWVALSICKRKSYSENRANNRRKKDTEDVKRYDTDMENENENENTSINSKEKEIKKDSSKFPLAENVNGLTDIQIGSAQELVRITKRVSISSSDVSDLWKVFKVQNLTGKKWYDSEGDIFSHFLNALKKQEFNIVEEKNNGQPKIKMK